MKLGQQRIQPWRPMRPGCCHDLEALLDFCFASVTKQLCFGLAAQCPVSAGMR